MSYLAELRVALRDQETYGRPTDKTDKIHVAGSFGSFGSSPREGFQFSRAHSEPEPDQRPDLIGTAERTQDAPGPPPAPVGLTDAPRRLWRITAADGAVAVHSFTPPATRADVAGWHPGRA